MAGTRRATVGTSLEVRPVRNRLARNRFVDVPFRLFRHDPAWVPHMRLSVHDRISPKHPALEHEQVALWMAYRNGKPVGRIGACVDTMFNEFQDESWAWVGFFEAFDDQAAADALFEAAWSWARGQGARTAVGPASFTTNDECGLLVDGFEHAPLVMTPQNPPYYAHLWTDGGWEPAMDLYGWHFTRDHTALSDRQRRVLERLRARADIRVRGVNMADFDAEVGRFFTVYNSAWSRNWGFAPMSEAEVRHLAKSLKQIVDPDLALIVETSAGEPIAVSLTLPDLNEPWRRVRSGRLLPFGWLPVLREGKTTTKARVWALGVRPDKQSLALGPLLYAEVVDRLRAKPHIQEAEASWILAVNDRMNSAIEAMGGTRYKTWRMYRHDL